MSKFPIRAGTVIEFIGAEVTWEILKTDNGWFVRASHHGLTAGDTFKFEAASSNFDVAVAKVGRKVWQSGPSWIKTFDNRGNWRRKRAGV